MSGSSKGGSCLHSEDAEAHLSAAGLLSESLKCSKTVDAYNLQWTLAQEYDKRLYNEWRRGRRMAVKSGFFYGLAQFCQFGSQALSLWYGGRAFAKGEINDIGEMMQGTFTLIIAAMGIGQSASSATETAEGKAAARRVFSLLAVSTSPDVRDESGHTRRQVFNKNFDARGQIEFRNLRFKFPDSHLPVYKDLTFKVPAGKSVAIVGESGCGKTTLVQLLERFYDIPADSAIYLGGVDLRQWNLRELRSCFSLVSQEPILFNDTIRKNIQYGKMDATTRDIEEAAKQAHAHDFIMEQPKGYDTMVGARGERLSGGQRQRIALARALLKESDVLLLDEATSALDPLSERIVQAAIDGIVAHSNKTVMIIAHRLSTIKNADIIVVLKKQQNPLLAGEFLGSTVVEIGTHQELLSKSHGEYQALVRSVAIGYASTNPVDDYA